MGIDRKRADKLAGYDAEGQLTGGNRLVREEKFMWGEGGADRGASV